MEYDYTKKEDRKSAIERLHREFFVELRNTKLGFHPVLRGRINRGGTVNIGIQSTKDPQGTYYLEFGSGMTLYLGVDDIMGKQDRGIGIGSSGTITHSDTASYFRTKHAMIVLDNWDLIFGIAEKYYYKLIELGKQIDEANGIHGK